MWSLLCKADTIPTGGQLCLDYTVTGIPLGRMVITSYAVALKEIFKTAI